MQVIHLFVAVEANQVQDMHSLNIAYAVTKCKTLYANKVLHRKIRIQTTMRLHFDGVPSILVEGAIVLPVTLSGGVQFAS